MTEQLRIAFLSGVRHAAPYIEILQRDPRVALVGVSEESEAPDWMINNAKALASDTGVRWYSDLSTLADPERIDLAIVCSEPTRHARLAEVAAQRGINVLIDKPVATSLAELTHLAAVIADNGVHCSVINRTHAPALRRLRSWIEAGHMGLPLHFDMEFFADGAHFTTSVERPELVVDRELSGGGEMMNFLGYCVDAITYASGLNVESVYAMTGNLFLEPHATHLVEDTAVISLGLEHGVSSTITVGRIPYAPGLGPTSTSMRVLGSHAHAIVDDDRPALELFGDGGLSASSFDGGQEALRRYLTHVVERSLAGQPSDYGLEAAGRSLAVIEAAYASATSGRPQRPTHWKVNAD